MLCIAIFLGCSGSKEKHENIAVNNLRCELLENPLGIDSRNPKLSWQIQSQQNNIKQTAYQIIVSSTKENSKNNIGDLWDSGKTFSDKSVHVEYTGEPLESNRQYFWKVKVWSENGETEWSAPATWSMGYIYYKDWKGRWIGLDKSFAWEDESQFSRLAARYFRKEISTKNKKFSRATAYIMGLGLYELYLNGNKVGNQVLSPTPTDYTKNVKYNVFDVTHLLSSGENCLGAILGNGRYYTMRQNYKPYKIKNFGYPKLMMNLVVEYDDGSNETFRTDDSWKVTADGPIRSNNEYDGEEYDARKEMPGWNNTGFNDQHWIQAEYVQQPRGEYEAQLNENIKVMHEVKPVSIINKKGNRFMLDMGQNMAGWLRMTVKGKQGDKITLRFAESLTESGELNTAPLRDAKVTDVYILKGGMEETWEPKFVYHGFRYVEITGYPGEPDLEKFTGCVVYDNMETIGRFETSDSLINQIYKNTWWTINSNYKGMPIDCPQRNERMPWLGDRAIGCYGESFVFDNSRLHIKWMDDIMYSQKADGSISDVAPPFFRYYSDNMTWPGAYIMVGDMLYRQYGLVDPIRKHYPCMKKWLEYMAERYLKDYVMTKDSYGDWCAPIMDIEEGKGKSANVKHPSQVIATAYYYYFLNVMQQFAVLTENSQDVASYKTTADSVKSAFNNSFFNKETSGYGKNTLTENILAVHFNLVTDENRSAVLQNIEQIISIENNGHLSSGLVGVQWLMRTLNDNGMQDIAWQLATNTTYPSWGYMVENGATTIWELWNANTAAPNMNSQNHVMMLGDLIIWYYECLAGIQSSTEYPGFKQIIMKPVFYDELDFVNASYQSVYGEIKSFWKKEEGKILWKIEIPANTTAKVYFPVRDKERIKCISDGHQFKFDQEGDDLFTYIGSGKYEFETQLSIQ